MRAMTRVLLLLTMVACGGSQLPRDQVSDPGQLIFEGYTKSEVKCFECHDGSGLGTKYGPSLAKRVPNLTDVALRARIVDGKGKMPSFKGKLSDPELDQLTAWLRKSFGGPPAAPIGVPPAAPATDAPAAPPAGT